MIGGTCVRDQSISDRVIGRRGVEVQTDFIAVTGIADQVVEVGALLRKNAVTDIFGAGVVHGQRGGSSDVEINSIHVDVRNRIISQDKSAGAGKGVAFGPDSSGSSPVDRATSDDTGRSASSKGDHVGIAHACVFVSKIIQGHVFDDDS